MTAEQTATENPTGTTSADYDSQSMTHEEIVNFQMPITTFSQLNEENSVLDSISTANSAAPRFQQFPITGDHHGLISQPTPAQNYYFQHSSPNPSSIVAGHHDHRIAEFIVPVDVERTTPSQTALTQPQIRRPIDVPDDMTFSIIMTFFFWPLGIPAMFFAAEANSLRTIDPKRALSKAKTARLLNLNAVMASVFITFSVILVYFFVMKH